MENKTIYDLKLHETMQEGDYCVTRVPGGWVYSCLRIDACTFVPYNEEYKFKK